MQRLLQQGRRSAGGTAHCHENGSRIGRAWCGMATALVSRAQGNAMAEWLESLRAVTHHIAEIVEMREAHASDARVMQKSARDQPRVDDALSVAVRYVRVAVVFGDVD